ncbi:MAG: glycosyltransferase family 2 protein [Desulfobaccales bacterium]
MSSRLFRQGLMTTELPFVSVIIPCRQERRHIGRMLESLLADEYPRERLEILVVDGSREIVTEFISRHPYIKLLDNPRQITPAALNIGVTAARGDVIIRADCHSTYPPAYISTLVAWLEKTGADNVGGVWRILPGAETAMARAIALGLAHPFGVGNAYYRLGASGPKWVDTVPFGCYRREVFRRLGLFDEDQVRTEDDEFNLRLRQQGGRILLVPDLRIDYYARESLPQIWRLYYYYGYFKPLVARKLGWWALSLRHLIPSLWVLTLGTSMLLGWWFTPLTYLGLAVLGAYVLADIYFALRAGRRQGLAVKAWLALVFPTLHFSYGLGFLKGWVDFFLRGKKKPADAAGLPLGR